MNNTEPNDKSWILPVVLILGLLFMYAGGWRLLSEYTGMAKHYGGMARHHKSMSGGIPDTYKGRQNPFKLTRNNINLGSQLYNENCAACHGESGRGNGPVAGSLYPPPADLISLMSMPVAQDDYLFWAVSEGGVQLKTAMPAFKDKLSESDRWKIIQYLQQL